MDHEPVRRPSCMKLNVYSRVARQAGMDMELCAIFYSMSDVSNALASTILVLSDDNDRIAKKKNESALIRRQLRSALTYLIMPPIATINPITHISVAGLPELAQPKTTIRHVFV